MKVSKENTRHYVWGDGCDGWVLAETHEFVLIQERMPPRTREKRHFHSKSRQFFYVLSGALTMELEGALFELTNGSGIEVAPGAAHHARNDGVDDVHFLVTSSPTTRDDRVEL